MLSAVSARNPYGAAVDVLLPQKSEDVLFGLSVWIAGQLLRGIEPPESAIDRSGTQGHESVLLEQQMLVWALEGTHL
jgi:hypothetical protein